MRNTGRIPSSDGNLIIFLDIPIAIEVPRFPPIICTFISIFYFWFLVSVNNFPISNITQNQRSAAKPKIILAIEK
jgi:hypothetical protein